MDPRRPQRPQRRPEYATHRLHHQSDVSLPYQYPTTPFNNNSPQPYSPQPYYPLGFTQTAQYQYPVYQAQSYPPPPPDGQQTWWYPAQPQHEGIYHPYHSSIGPHDVPDASTSHTRPIPIPQQHQMGYRHSQSQSLPSSSSVRPVFQLSSPIPLVQRRSYHPKTPPHRSEWVMWVGNVPSDATHDELWKFFNSPPITSDSSTTVFGGVVSIFLLSRSSCAFINFKSDAYLTSAVERFNGKQLRSTDRCPSFVCRVRKKEDDLKAGVGAQRGVGIHKRWIKEQAQKSRDLSLASTPIPLITSTAPRSTSSPPHPVQASSSSRSTTSYGSTTSSILREHFPKRYFILKSLTQVCESAIDEDVANIWRS